MYFLHDLCKYGLMKVYGGNSSLPAVWGWTINELTLNCFFMFFPNVHRSIDWFHLPTLMHKFYSLKICMLHYNPRHVSSINMPIFRRTNFIITASDIVTLCKRLYSMPDESRLCLLSSGILDSHLQRVTIPDAVIIQFVLLKMDMLMLETCQGL